ncbi:MAG: hypothetical protein R3Y56_11280, partial [Akkermansia sp.]
WASPAFAREIQHARESKDANPRLQHLATAERIMLDAQPIIPLYWSERCYFVSPMVKGFYPSLLETQPLDAVELKID